MSKNNYHFGTINEILTGFYLTSQWKKFEEETYIRTKLKEVSNEICPSEYKDIERISSMMAKNINAWLFTKKKTVIKSVKWVAGTNHTDPSDLHVTLYDDSIIGISCKCSFKSNQIGFKNYSFNTIASNHFVEPDFMNKLKSYDDAVLEKYGLQKETQNQRKHIIRDIDNCWLKDELKIYNRNKMFAAREFLLEKLNSLTNPSEYIYREWFNINEDEHVEYLKVHGNIAANKVFVQHYSSDSLEEKKNVSMRFERGNGCGITVFEDDEPLFAIRVKNNSEMFASSIKAHAVPVGFAS